MTTEAQQAIIDRIMADTNRPPRQRVRTAAQGATLGSSDELEARARSLASGRPYSEVLSEIRGGLEAYREDRPIESMLFELGGAAVPALLSRGATAPVSLGRMARVGALQGGAYGFGTGEGLMDRLARVPGGLAGGAFGGLLGGAISQGAANAANLATDVLRRGVGRRGSSVVENEIQRLAAQTGRTPDDIAADIEAGRILAEDPNISMAVRTLRAQGGEPSRILQETLERRPAMTRQEAMAAMREYLAPGAETGALRAARYSEETARAAERELYRQFENMPAPAEVVEDLGEALRRVPAASREVEEALLASTGQRPFYQIAEDGTVTFTRAPTVDEAERVRRAIANRASSLYSEGMGGAGGAVSDVGEELRNILDFSIPELRSTRAQAAARFANSRAFEAGRRALTGDVNERLLEFENLADPEAVQAYRAGFMSALEARTTSGRRASLIRNLADPNQESAENIMLRAVIPEESLEGVLSAVETAARSQTAASRILPGAGSPTQDVALEAQRQGMNVSAADVLDVLGGSPIAIARVASNIIGPMARGLSDAERTRIAEILVSESPDLVRRALVDDSALAALQTQVGRIMMRAASGGQRAGAVAGAMPTAEVTGAGGSGLLGAFNQ